MKIIKDGKRNTGAFKCKCKECGCKFVADVSDYTYVKWTYADGYKPTENNAPSEEIMTTCPNCNNKVTKNLFKKDNSLSSVLGIINVVFNILALIYVVGFEPVSPKWFTALVAITNVILIGINFINFMSIAVDGEGL